MASPQLSIIIPTHNRPHLLPLAVQSALGQTVQDLEVVVVDDASDDMPPLPVDPRLRVIRLDTGVGGAGARNVGTRAAQSHWITYLDDDDCLLPTMAEVTLAALADLPDDGPVAVLSGLQVVNPQGEVLLSRLPPTRSPQGSYFFLETPEPGKSFHTKQTLVVERDLILKIGGWDETFRSRVHSELFLRLNPVCTLVGLPTVTYQLLAHDQARVSGNPALRQESFQRLVTKHRSSFAAHPKMFAEFVYNHALKSHQMGQDRAALTHLLWALQLCPSHISRQAGQYLLAYLTRKFKVESLSLASPS